MGGQPRVLVQVCGSSVSLKSGLMVVLHEDETNLSALIAKSLPALSPRRLAGLGRDGYGYVGRSARNDCG